MSDKNGWIDTFKREHWTNTDGKFSSNVMFLGDSSPSRTEINNLKFVTPNSDQEKIYHDEFQILTRYISNYVMYRGKSVHYAFWSPEQDSAMRYFQENFMNHSESRSAMRTDYLTDYKFDWRARKLTKFYDAGLRKKNQWLDENKWWEIDAIKIGYESDDPEFQGSCIVAKDLYGWNTKSANIIEDYQIEHTTSGNETYLFALFGNMQINGVDIEKNTVLKVVSDNIVIRSTDAESVVIIKEKNETHRTF